MDLKFATQCIYGKKEKFEKELTGTISFPIYQTATYAHPEVGKSTGFDYSRLQNPTREQLEKVVATLEKGIDALAFSSGMAAITAFMEIFKPGDHLITDADLYGGSIRFFDHINEKNGLTFDHINCSKEDVESYIKPNTKAIFIETPTNPMMSVVDIRKIAAIAKKHNLLLIVDNTFMSIIIFALPFSYFSASFIISRFIPCIAEQIHKFSSCNAIPVIRSNIIAVRQTVIFILLLGNHQICHYRL